VKRSIPFFLVLFVVVALAGCAAGPNELAASPDASGEVAGFWLGLWHGFISMFTFIISLFKESVSVYEVHNSGGWYDLGFVLGVSCFFGGSGGGAARKR
jgi:hypothetical protein